MRIGKLRFRAGYAWSLGLLIGAVAAALGLFFTAERQDFQSFLVFSFLMVILGIASSTTALATGARRVISAQRKGTGVLAARNLSLWSLGLLAAAAIIALSLSLSALVPMCAGPDADSCAFGIFVPLFPPLEALTGGGVIVAILALGVGVFSAAKTSQWAWFAGILVYGFGSLTIATYLFMLPQANVFEQLVFFDLSDPLFLLGYAPLLIPVITLLYGLFALRRSTASVGAPAA